MRCSLRSGILTGRVKKRSQTDLDILIELKGAEEEIARALLDRFKSLARIKKLSVEELQTISGIGKKRAKLLHDQLRKL